MATARSPPEHVDDHAPGICPGGCPTRSLRPVDWHRLAEATDPSPNDAGQSRARLIPLRFQAYKISGGRGVLKNAPSPGPLSPKTFRIWVGCPDCSSSAPLTCILKKFLKEGFGEARSFKKGSPEFLYLRACIGMRPNCRRKPSSASPGTDLMRMCVPGSKMRWTLRGVKRRSNLSACPLEIASLRSQSSPHPSDKNF